MSSAAAGLAFQVGDVPYGERLHRDTAKKVTDLDDGEFLLKVRAKKRPVLVFGPPSGHEEYPVMEFTTKRPENNHADFALHENGKPRSFGKKLGFNDLSYLRVYPANQCPASRLQESGIDSFPRIAMQSFTKMYMDRLMHVPVTLQQGGGD